MTQINCFVTVSRYKNFSKAAEALFMSQPAVSKNIIALEEEIGLQLFLRTGRSFVISEEGHILLRYFTRILSLYDQTSEVIGELKRKPPDAAKRIRLLGISAMARYGIIDSVRKFSALYPDVMFSIEESEESSVLAQMLTGDFDIAFCTDLKLDPAFYDWQTYRSEVFSVVVSSNSPLAKQDSVCMADLRNCKLILESRETNLYFPCVKACQKAGFEPEVVMATSRPPLALDFLVGHENYAFITPKTPFASYQSFPNKVLEITDSPSFNFVMAWSKGVRFQEHVNMYLNFIKDKDFDDIINYSVSGRH
jgi:DNA-binding transcriptional LysR family regulator